MIDQVYTLLYMYTWQGDIKQVSARRRLTSVRIKVEKNGACDIFYQNHQVVKRAFNLSHHVLSFFDDCEDNSQRIGMVSGYL